MKFSVLLSVYHKEKPQHLKDCFESIENQTLPPNEILLVEDGPLTTELYNEIEKWKSRISFLKVVQLEKNSGLATALNFGIKHCAHEIIARMDTDDICTPDRFEKQINFLQENPDIDLIGCQIAEYDETMTKFLHNRILPCEHKAIIKFAKKRVPFNHMTVVYKKKQVLEVGGYAEHVRIMQDWTLWGKLFVAGRKAANLNEILVKARTGNELFNRRRGWEYIKSETAAIQYLYQVKFLSLSEYLFNVISHTAIRLLPKSMIKQIYKFFLRK